MIFTLSQETAFREEVEPAHGQKIFVVILSGYC
jgi:hypothetical protein